MNRVLALKSLTPFVFAFSLVAGDTALAKIVTVQVTGEVAAVAGDRAATEAAVKREARRKAVEEGAGTLVESNTIVRNYQMISDEIATTAKGVISNEEWGNMKVNDGVASITLTAKVSPVAIENAICTVIKANHNPKITFLFVEKIGDDSQPWAPSQAERGLVEALLTEAFLDSCFTLVESGVTITTVGANGDIPQAAIQEAVKNANAEWILAGKAKITRLAHQDIIGKGGMKSYNVVATGRLINAETNEIVVAASGQTTLLGINPSVAVKNNPDKGERMVDSLMGQFISKIGARWSSDLVNASKVSVTVNGIKNFAAAKNFSKTVESTVSGAQATRRSLKKGVALYDVDVDGGADALALGIDGKKVGKYTIEVLEVTRGKVVLQLK